MPVLEINKTKKGEDGNIIYENILFVNVNIVTVCICIIVATGTSYMVTSYLSL